MAEQRSENDGWLVYTKFYTGIIAGNPCSLQPGILFFGKTGTSLFNIYPGECCIDVFFLQYSERAYRLSPPPQPISQMESNRSVGREAVSFFKPEMLIACPPSSLFTVSSSFIFCLISSKGISVASSSSFSYDLKRRLFITGCKGFHGDSRAKGGSKYNGRPYTIFLFQFIQYPFKYE